MITESANSLKKIVPILFIRSIEKFLDEKTFSVRKSLGTCYTIQIYTTTRNIPSSTIPPKIPDEIQLFSTIKMSLCSLLAIFLFFCFYSFTVEMIYEP
jgi:hypothetical protein